MKNAPAAASTSKPKPSPATASTSNPKPSPAIASTSKPSPARRSTLVRVGYDDDDDDDDDDLEFQTSTYMIIPPDGGWGWVIMICGFYCNLITTGMQYAIGSYAQELSNDLGASMEDISLLGALQSAFLNLFGPIASGLINRFGFRVVVVLGGVIASTGYGLSYYATSMLFLHLSFGVLGGIGFCLIYLPASIATSFYFERWRALTSCIVVCGAGVGGSVIPPLVELTIKTYGWRLSMLFQAGGLLSCCLVGLLYRPLSPSRVLIQTEETLPALRAIQSTKTLMESRFSFGRSLTSTQRIRSRFVGLANNNFPTIADTLTGSAVTIVNRKRNNSIKMSTYALLRGMSMASTTDTRKSMGIRNKDKMSVMSVRRPSTHPGTRSERFILGGDNVKINSKPEKKTCCTCLNKMCCKKNPDNIRARPIYRDDAFYAGSLFRLPNYQNEDNGMGYHMTVTRLTTDDDLEEEQSSRCICFPESITRTVFSMLDFALFRSESFLILLVNGCFAQAALLLPFIYVPARVKKIGIDPEIASFLIPIISIASTISRIGFGIVTSMPKANVTIINMVCLAIGGITLICSGFSSNSEFQIFYCSMFGLALACFFSLRTVMIVELLGLEKLTNAFGLLLLFQGIAALLGPPVGGALFSIREEYDDVFWFAGTLLLLSAVVTIPLPWINRREKEKNKHDTAV